MGTIDIDNPPVRVCTVWVVTGILSGTSDGNTEWQAGVFTSEDEANQFAVAARRYFENNQPPIYRGNDRSERLKPDGSIPEDTNDVEFWTWVRNNPFDRNFYAPGGNTTYAFSGITYYIEQTHIMKAGAP